MQGNGGEMCRPHGGHLWCHALKSPHLAADVLYVVPISTSSREQVAHQVQAEFTAISPEGSPPCHEPSAHRPPRASLAGQGQSSSSWRLSCWLRDSR